MPPVGNGNFAWVQHFIYHLAPNGVAGFVLANGSLSSNTSGEGTIRQAIIEADLVDCIVAMPGQLFYSTPIPVALWFLARNKHEGKGNDEQILRDRRGEVLFIDARQLGYLEDRTHRNLGESDIATIVQTYHSWREKAGGYEDSPGFCRSTDLTMVKEQGFVLTPGRYVGVEKATQTGELVNDKLNLLTQTLEEQFNESARLETQIRANLQWLNLISLSTR